MLYVLLIYERPDDFARRDSSAESEAYAGAWRAYHRALLDAGIFVGGKPLDAPETATTVRLRAAVKSQPCGFFGIPSRGHVVNAATSASANASSAAATSRVRIASSATRRP